MIRRKIVFPCSFGRFMYVGRVDLGQDLDLKVISLFFTVVVAVFYGDFAVFYQ